jgi:putative ABC transport system ATP-binding protein
MTNYFAAANDSAFEDSPQKAAPAFILKNVRQIREGQVVLDDIDLEIASEAITALVGPSGAGKTSLLRLLNRLDDAASGEIFFRSRPIDEYGVQELRRRVGFVFQTPVMFPGTVADNLRSALELAEKPVADSQGLISEMLALAELDSSLAERDGARLSVGQKQRVNIARALMTAPEVLLMDEPTSALDPETADKLMETVRRLGKEKGITVVMITHRLSEARRASDETIVMEAGRVIETGATDYIFERTANPRIREFLDGGK